MEGGREPSGLVRARGQMGGEETRIKRWLSLLCFYSPPSLDSDGEKPGKPLAPPRLGELTVTDVTSSSLLLHWTVPEGEFDSFVIQYKDRDQPRVVPAEGPQRSALITNLDVGRKYKFLLYGFVGKKRHGPLMAEAKICK